MRKYGKIGQSENLENYHRIKKLQRPSWHTAILRKGSCSLQWLIMELRNSDWKCSHFCHDLPEKLYFLVEDKNIPGQVKLFIWLTWSIWRYFYAQNSFIDHSTIILWLTKICILIEVSCFFNFLWQGSLLKKKPYDLNNNYTYFQFITDQS